MFNKKRIELHAGAFAATLVCLGFCALPEAAKAQQTICSGICFSGFDNPFGATGIELQRKVQESEAQANAYSALRRQYGDVAGDPQAALQLQLYRQRQLQMQRYSQQQYYSSTRCYIQPRPMYDYRGVFVGYRQAQVCY